MLDLVALLPLHARKTAIDSLRHVPDLVEDRGLSDPDPLFDPSDTFVNTDDPLLDLSDLLLDLREPATDLINQISDTTPLSIEVSGHTGLKLSDEGLEILFAHATKILLVR